MSKKVRIEPDLGCWGYPSKSEDSLSLGMTQEELTAKLKAITPEEWAEICPQHTGFECFANISRTYFWCCPTDCPKCALDKKEG